VSRTLYRPFVHVLVSFRIGFPCLTRTVTRIRYVHDKYLENDNYYKAAVLRVGNLDNADQRIVEDLNQVTNAGTQKLKRDGTRRKPRLSHRVTTWAASRAIMPTPSFVCGN